MACFGTYLSNGDFSPGNDQVGNMLFSVNLLKRHALSLSPPDAPHSFFWTLEQPGAVPRSVAIDEWNSAADTAYRQGQLTAPTHYYYLARTIRPDEYVSTFGIGAPLAGLPVYAVLDLFVDIESNRHWWWHGGALTASLLTAFAAVFVFLSARRFVKPLPAFLTALAFGLGSCAWPVSSQALWQHPASTFCLSLGAWFLLCSPERLRAAAWCGAAFGMAVLCRPTTAVVVVCAGAYLLWVDRRRFAAYVLGGIPFLVILAAYNGYYFGSPFVFGQTVASEIIALGATGSEDLWQSSWRESLPGLLISPSRGLLWFSPVLLFGLISAVTVWTDHRYRPLVPLQAGVALTILVAGKWFDWIGGATWGYRPIVDVTPFLALLMVPIIERIVANRGTRVLFGALLAWSVAAQFVGAYAYSGTGWIDQWREHDDPDRASVWSWQRPQIGYHVAHFGAERALKREVMAQYVNARNPIINVRDLQPRFEASDDQVLRVSVPSDPAEQHNIAEALRKQGRYEEALEAYHAVLAIDPEYALTHAAMGDTLFRLERYEEALQALVRATSLQHDLPMAGSLQRLMGQASQNLGRPGVAAEHYERAVQIDPRDTKAIDRLAMLRFGEQRYEAALDLYRTLAEINPDSAQTHANMGAALYYLDRPEEAIRSFEHALSLDPNLEAARTGLQQLRKTTQQAE